MPPTKNQLQKTSPKRDPRRREGLREGRGVEIAVSTVAKEGERFGSSLPLAHFRRKRHRLRGTRWRWRSAPRRPRRPVGWPRARATNCFGGFLVFCFLFFRRTGEKEIRVPYYDGDSGLGQEKDLYVRAIPLLLPWPFGQHAAGQIHLSDNTHTSPKKTNI